MSVCFIFHSQWFCQSKHTSCRVHPSTPLGPREVSRRKELDKKKARDMERMKKREMAHKAENRNKHDRDLVKSSTKGRRDEDRQPTQVKV